MARKESRIEEERRPQKLDGRGGGRRRSGGGRGTSSPWSGGSDAAYIEPRDIPDYELLPRDDSGGPEWEPYTQMWGDGGYVLGDKAHLSARGGRDDPKQGDEISNKIRNRGGRQ